MNVSKSTFPILIAAVITLGSQFIAPASVRADTFAIFNLGTDNGYSIYGIDDSGTVVIQGFGQYQTYVGGALVSSSTTIPTLNYDNGTPCTPTVSAPITWSSGIGHTRCNNGHEVYAGKFPGQPPNPFDSGLFTGPDLTDHLTDPSMPVVNGSPVDQVAMNASGDFVWADGAQELFFEAIDLTTPTPEPSSILLVGTGVLAAAGTMRRRFRQ